MSAWTNQKQRNQTEINRHSFESAKDFVDNCLHDKDKEERLKGRECKSCYYTNNLLYTQGTCTATCHHCNVTMPFYTGRTDVLCEKCSIETGSCKHCGAELD